MLWLGLAAAALLHSCHGALMPDSTLNMTEIVWIGPESRHLYVGSPSIVRVPSNNMLLASHDFFGASTEDFTVPVYSSSDEGQTWQFFSNASGLYWAELFVYQNDVYLSGVDGGDASKSRNIVISKLDSLATKTWSKPAVLFRGNDSCAFHCAPTPILFAQNKVFRAFETSSPYPAVMTWADMGADLMQASSWHISTVLTFNQSWVPAAWGGTQFEWQEGNAVEGPNGEIFDILRIDKQTTTAYNKAALTQLDPSTGVLSFKQFVDFPACSSKFMIRRAPNKMYYTLSTDVTAENVKLNLVYARNHLVLAASADLIHWKTCTTLLYDDTGFDATDSARFTGFHYVSWIFSGNDIYYAVRTGYRGANSYHNANRLTFKIIENYASLC
eukprot:m.312665 g.312665  ORF g.312665 m.312665 type:complete len:386 (+) comp23048_c0_seq36:3911-5068(+)